MDSRKALARPDSLRDHLRNLQGRAGLSTAQLVARTRLGRTTISQALNNGSSRPSWRTVAALAKAMDVDEPGIKALRDLWHAAGPAQVDNAAADSGPEQTIGKVGPLELEVHRAVLAAPDPGSYAFLTPYLSRAHDVELRAHLAPALAGGDSVLVMATGDSATGKTRALYEALGELAPGRPLLCPADAGALLDLLRNVRVEAGAVLWLNEAQRFFYGLDAETAAAQLRRLLVSTRGVVAVGTLWTDPYWEELTRPGRAADPHGQVRGLLDCAAARRVMVPDHLSEMEQRQWLHAVRREESKGDQRLLDALAAGTSDGRVVQHLSGGPALLAAYLGGPGSHFNHVEHALLTAAIDARRLGHRSPLPAGLLADAADGTLHPRQRLTEPDWAFTALKALSTGERSDGRRTDIRHTLTALNVPLNRSGTEPAYEPADYLDRHLRLSRSDQPGTAALWKALLDHTVDPDALVELAATAQAQGRRKYAALLLCRAVLAGHPACAHDLIVLLDDDKDPHQRGAVWTATHARLIDPDGVSRFLRVLASTGRHTAVTVLIQRDPVAHVDCDDPEAVTQLLNELRKAEQEEAVVRLAERAVRESDLTDAGAATELLMALQYLELHEASNLLADRAVMESGATDMAFTPTLLEALTAGHPGQAAAYADRAVSEIDITDTSHVTSLMDALQEQGMYKALTRLLDRDPAAYVDTGDPESVGWLLETLSQLGRDEVVANLIDQGLAERVDIDDPDAVASLLHTLVRCGHFEAATELSGRAAMTTDISHPNSVAELLESLQGLGQDDALVSLLNRDLAGSTLIDDPESIGPLLEVLAGLGQDEAVATLATRAAAFTDVSDVDAVAWLLEALQRAEQATAAATLLTRAAAVSEINDYEESAWLQDALVKIGLDETAAALQQREDWRNATALPRLYSRDYDKDGVPESAWTWDGLGQSERPGVGHRCDRQWKNTG